MRAGALSLTARFLRAHNGNVGIIFGLVAVPAFLASAMAVDYATAARARTQLQAIADSAALAATTPAMLLQSATEAKSAAAKMFAAQATLQSTIGFTASNLSVTVTDTTAATGTTRKAVVTYAAEIANAFGALTGHATTPYTVTATASVTKAPNINFYVLLDNSPSMELPATSAGVTAMQTKTGCAFACHESNVSDSLLTVKYSGWGTIDSYTFAQKAGIALRIDNVRTAAQNLVSTTISTMASTGATYNLAYYDFHEGFESLISLKTPTSSNKSAMTTALAALTPPLLQSKDCLPSGSSYTYPTSSSTYKTVTLGSSSSSGGCANGAFYGYDAMTDFGQAMTKINAIMPTPGNGTNTSGDTPQEVLMIVSDGVDDAGLYSSSACSQTALSYTNKYGTFYRCQQPFSTAYCTTIKNRGIRIAVLYTTYQPVTSFSWYNSYIKPFIAKVATNLEACASTGLYSEVTTDDDISAALATLFQKAIATSPHLTQ